jgi:hypothetical protein
MKRGRRNYGRRKRRRRGERRRRRKKKEGKKLMCEGDKESQSERRGRRKREAIGRIRTKDSDGKEGDQEQESGGVTKDLLKEAHLERREKKNWLQS